MGCGGRGLVPVLMAQPSEHGLAMLGCMLAAMTVDFGRTASDYGRYRAGFPNTMFDRLSQYGVGTRGQRVVDVGTGTGTVARGFALRGCDVVGVDPSEELVGEARRLDREAAVNVDYRIARAEETGLGDGSVDVYAAGQCWHWFDRPSAAAEARRVLAWKARSSSDTSTGFHLAATSSKPPSS